MAKSNRETIETSVRSMIRNVYNASMSSNTNYFTLFTNHIPLGLKAL